MDKSKITYNLKVDVREIKITDSEIIFLCNAVFDPVFQDKIKKGIQVKFVSRNNM